MERDALTTQRRRRKEGRKEKERVKKGDNLHAGRVRVEHARRLLRLFRITAQDQGQQKQMVSLHPRAPACTQGNVGFAPVVAGDAVLRGAEPGIGSRVRLRHCCQAEDALAELLFEDDDWRECANGTVKGLR